MTNKLKIAYFQRKARKFGNFSIEFIFEEIRKNLPADMYGILYTARYESAGLWKRLYIALAAAGKQEDINHITGDIHFANAFLRKHKTILTIHDVGFMAHSSSVSRFLLWLFWIWLPVKRSQVVVAVSHATKNEILKYIKCDPEKIKVIYDPISKDLTFKPKEFNHRNPIILQLGCAPNKNLARTIKALKDIPCHFEIIGKLGQEEINLLQAYKISYKISYNLSNEEVQRKYEDCDMLTLVSTYEGFGMPIIEANRVGRPVITSNILSMPEVAGEAACLVNPFDIENIKNGFLRVINDAEYRAKLIENGRENQKRFQVTEIARQYSEIYRSLVKC